MLAAFDGDIVESVFRHLAIIDVAKFSHILNVEILVQSKHTTLPVDIWRIVGQATPSLDIEKITRVILNDMIASINVRNSSSSCRHLITSEIFKFAFKIHSEEKYGIVPLLAFITVANGLDIPQYLLVQNC